MLLIILGLIIVGGALFLILSSKKFKLPSGRRLRGGYNGFGFGGFDGIGALQDGDGSFKMPFEDGASPQAGAENNPAGTEEGTQVKYGDDSGDDGKVLYIFGSNEREERPLDEDDNQDE